MLGVALIIVVLFPVVCWSEGKIYTNEDLEKYQGKKIQVSPVVPEKQNKNVEHGTILNIGRGSVREESNEKVNREINLYIAECPTYQSSFSTGDNSGGGTVRVMSKGRSIEEMCASIGQGCKVCYEAAY